MNLDENISKIANILNEQYNTQKELLSAEQKKMNILVSGEVEELNNIINKEQALIMNSDNLEKQREALCKLMGIERFFLREFADMYDNDNKKGIKSVLQGLTTVMFELKKAGAQNNKLLKTRLITVQYMKNTIAALTGTNIDEACLTYKKS